MDPITLIIAALVAGASAGLKDTASSAVKDAYTRLKSLLRRHFGHADIAVEGDLAAIDAKPDADTSRLKDLLAQTGAADNAELVQAALTLLRQAQPRNTITITNSKGIIGTNYGESTMIFNEGG